MPERRWWWSCNVDVRADLEEVVVWNRGGERMDVGGV
jgi:hypothetical protein